MGDECHNRNRAATSLFLRAIGPALARTNQDNEVLAKVIEFIDRNDHFFLNLSMPAGKAMLEPAEGVRGQHHRHRDGAQRHRLRHPPGVHAGALVHRPGRQGAGAVLPAVHREGRQPRHRRQHHHRDRRLRRHGHGRRARHHPVRGRHAADGHCRPRWKCTRSPSASTRT